MAKYDKIGAGYNRTRKPDPHLIARMLGHLAPQPNGHYLDIGCGSGNYTHAFRLAGGNWIGVDPSEHMLALAKSKPSSVDWRLGKAESVPLETEALDAVVGSLTLHHWDDLEKGFTNLSHGLKPGGRMVIFTATPKQMEGYWLNHYFPGMLRDSMVQMPAFDTIRAAMEAAGLELVGTDPYLIREDLQDLFLYCGKHDPELYFREDVRHGISSFSALANAEEVERGLIQLRKDIDTGQIATVQADYAHDGGDYLYMIAEKGH